MASNHFLPPLPTASNKNIHDRKVYNKLSQDDINETHQIEAALESNNLEDGLLEKESPLIQLQIQRPGNDILCMESTQLNDEEDINSSKSISSMTQKWPTQFNDESAIHRKALSPLPATFEEIEKQIERTGSILVRIITWNQQAQPLPTVDELRRDLFPRKIYHVVAVGTQECENSISKSIFNPSKEKWEGICEEVMGNEYQLLRSHALQASHLSVYVHKAILHLVSNVKSLAIPTGICDKLGNKGGIGISLLIGKSSICFMTAHLAAHQSELDRRTTEFVKISREIALALGHKIKYDEQSTSTSSSMCQTDGIFQQVGNGKCFNHHMEHCNICCCASSDKSQCETNPLSDAFDFVFWGGDFNFRINGTRQIIDTLLANNQNEILMDHDQLRMLIQFDRSFMGFSEGRVTFRPTYKFDRGSDNYDTSSKRRIPAWTDRILYKTDSDAELLSYCSIQEIRSSDHRPVYASFKCTVDIENSTWSYRGNAHDSNMHSWKSESKSEVCVVS